ncbi:MAG TPA: hypothetical protein VKA98_08390 [Nitrososphaeraceae archaeon]|nr:hypothetical protein [Nitrososphaeraceae archaeon]
MIHSQNKTTTNSVAIIAIIAALALLRVVKITVFIIADQPETQRTKNCPRPAQFGPGFNNAQKHCLPKSKVNDTHVYRDTPGTPTFSCQSEKNSLSFDYFSPIFLTLRV